MTLPSKWRVLKLAIRCLIIVVCWSVGYIVYHQATQSVPSNIRPASVNSNLSGAEIEKARNTSSLVTTVQTTSTAATVSTLKVSQESQKLHYLLVAPDIRVNYIELIKKLASKVPSLPLEYQKPLFEANNSTCTTYPGLFDINFHNEIWQEWTSKASGATFYIFGAYWDNRRENNPAVRLLVMVNRNYPPVVICQLWYSKNEDELPFAVETNRTSSYAYMWSTYRVKFSDEMLQPHLLTCSLSSRKDPPLSVSLVDEPCENANNNVLVVVGKERRKEATPNSTLKFAVCVKGMDFYFNDISVRLIEWLELLRQFGVDKVFVYELALHPNVTKVLKYYEKQNFVHVSRLTLPGRSLNEKALINIYLEFNKLFKRLAELIPYNDCFYRHRHDYDYIVLLDVDEIIVPLKDNTWNDLLLRVLNGTKRRDSYYAKNVYFYDDPLHSHGWDKDVPSYMHMMQHVWRATNHSRYRGYVKSFFSTQTVLTLHNHFPINCLNSTGGIRDCNCKSIDVDFAQLQHYLRYCVSARSILKNCDTRFYKNLTIDDNLRRYLEPVANRTNVTLLRLGLMN